MENKKIAIISFFHEETSLCLAKALAFKGVKVDYYLIADSIRDKGYQAGIEYMTASNHPGFVTLNKDNAPVIVNYFKGLNVTLHLFRLLSFSSKLLWFNKIIIKECLYKIKKQKYDIINLVGQHPWLIYFYNELKGENIVHTIHEVGSHQNGIASTPLIDHVINERPKVIFHSNYLQKRFLSLPNARTCKCTVIPFGKFETNLLYKKDTENFQFKLEENKLIFLFYGYLKPYKGLDLLKEAFQKVKSHTNDFYLILAGSGDDPNLDFFKSEHNCRVINHFMTDEEMMKLNEIATVNLLPYKSASQSGIIPVSFMFGNPIIATNVGALPEYIDNGKNGIIVPSGDADAFADAMLKMINDNVLLHKLQDGAKKFGHGDRFDWSNIADETIKFYLS